MWPSVARAAVLLALAGCTALTSFDGLSGSPTPVDDGGAAKEPAKPIDAAVPPVETSVKVPTEVPVDGGAAIDAGPDAPTPAQRWCATLTPKPLACADFDDGALPPGWSPSKQGSGATPIVNATDARSPPYSVYLFVPPGGPTGHSSLERKLTAVPATEVRLAFAVKVDVMQSPGDFELGTIKFPQPTGNAYELQLEIINGELNVEEEIPPSTGETNNATGLPFTLGAWHEVELKIIFEGGGSKVTVSRDGSAPFTKAISAHDFKAAPTILIGYDGTTTSASLRYDNIVVDVK